jgi:hypothetical protein
MDTIPSNPKHDAREGIRKTNLQAAVSGKTLMTLIIGFILAIFTIVLIANLIMYLWTIKLLALAGLAGMAFVLTYTKFVPRKLARIVTRNAKVIRSGAAAAFLIFGILHVITLRQSPDGGDSAASVAEQPLRTVVGCDTDEACPDPDRRLVGQFLGNWREAEQPSGCTENIFFFRKDRSGGLIWPAMYLLIPGS